MFPDGATEFCSQDNASLCLKPFDGFVDEGCLANRTRADECIAGVHFRQQVEAVLSSNEQAIGVDSINRFANSFRGG